MLHFTDYAHLHSPGALGFTHYKFPGASKTLYIANCSFFSANKPTTMAFIKVTKYACSGFIDVIQ